MTRQAAASRYEQEMLNEAQRAGSRSRRNKSRKSPASRRMAAAETSVDDFRQKQEQAQETAHFFGQSKATDALQASLTAPSTQRKRR